jgi:hypothetical protein
MSTLSAVPPAIAEDKDGASEGILLKGFLTAAGKSIDPAAKVSRLDRHEDLHVRRDLKHHPTLQNPRDRASRSAAS